MRSLEKFVDLEGPWRAATAGDPARTIHVSFPWLRAWWEAFGTPRGMCMLVARAGDRILGLAPLMMETRSLGGVPVPVLRLVGNDVSPRSDIVLLDRKVDVIAAFVDAMATLPWVCFDCGQVPATSEAPALLARHVGAAFVSIERRHILEVPGVALEGSWDEYLARRSRNFRRSVRRALARGRGQVVRAFPGDLADLDQVLAAVRAVSGETWAHREGSSLVARPRDWVFYERLMRAALREGRLTVRLTYAGDCPIAFMILVGYQGVLYALKMGHRESSSEEGPGFRLMAACLEAEFHRRAWRRVDLDCVTTHADWKQRWTTGSEAVASYYCFRRSGLARVVAVLYRAKKWIEGRRHRGRTDATLHPLLGR